MKGGKRRVWGTSGICLMEVVISVGVLAMVIPLVLAVMASCGESERAARAESRSCVMIATCREELREARQGKSELLAGLADGRPFPQGDAVCALAFSESGKVIGAVDPVDYLRGLTVLQGESVGYITSMQGEGAADEGAARLMDVRVAFEYPAVAGAGRRKQVVYHIRMP